MEVYAYSKKRRHKYVYKLEEKPFVWSQIKWTNYSWTLKSAHNTDVDVSGHFQIFAIVPENKPFFKFYLSKYGYYYSILFELFIIFFLPIFGIIAGLIFSLDLAKILVGRLRAWASKIFGSLTIKREKPTSSLKAE